MRLRSAQGGMNPCERSLIWKYIFNHCTVTFELSPASYYEYGRTDGMSQLQRKRKQRAAAILQKSLIGSHAAAFTTSQNKGSQIGATPHGAIIHSAPAQSRERFYPANRRFAARKRWLK